MKILSAEQVRAWDKYTIDNEPISSFDLMERAALAFIYWFTSLYSSEKNVFVFCGTGNNGGDGLAIARLLHQRFFNVQIFICKISKNETEDFKKNILKYCLIVPKYCPKGMPSARGISMKEMHFR